MLLGLLLMMLKIISGILNKMNWVNYNKENQRLKVAALIIILMSTRESYGNWIDIILTKLILMIEIIIFKSFLFLIYAKKINYCLRISFKNIIKMDKI